MTDRDARAFRVLWEAIDGCRTTRDRFHLRLEIEIAVLRGRITEAQARELHQALHAGA